MSASVDPRLALLASSTGMPAWRNIVFVAFFVAASVSIVLGIVLQVWVAAVQLRRFSRIFGDRPEAAQAFTRLFATYGWRARLAVRLFRIPVPPGI